MASEKITAIIEELKGLTVLELSELVHAVEDEFGVSAAAAVAVAGPAEAASAAAEQTEFDVVLKSAGGNKIAVIRLFVRSQVLVLRKLRLSLTAHLRLLKRLYLRTRLMRLNLSSKQLALKLKLSNLISKVFYPDGFIRRDFLFGFLLRFLYQKLGNYGLA